MVSVKSRSSLVSSDSGSGLNESGSVGGLCLFDEVFLSPGLCEDLNTVLYN